jgi:predicted dehydrogenase
VDVEDVAEITLQFAGGTLGSVHVDMVRQPPRRFLEVTGEAGVVRWDYEENRVLLYAPTARAWRVEEGAPTFVRNDLYLAELRQFAEACSRGAQDEPLADGRQAAAILAVALAVLRSTAEGCAVDLAAEGEPVVTWLNALSAIRRG